MLPLFATAMMLTAVLGAPSARHAIIIAAPRGGYGDAPLAYAQSDALQVADVLRRVGGFAPNEVEVVLQPSRATLNDVFGRVRDNGLHDNDFLFVYYSGHGDAFGMHLGGERVAWRELLYWTSKGRVHTRLLVVDACNSGALTQLKGGKRAAAFMPDIAESSRKRVLPRGLAILTSSGASEFSVESATFSASLFTHHFVAALSGAADRNNDGAVSLSEAYEYTTDRLETAQASYERQHQHPTFRYSLRGNSDLWVSRIQAKNADGAVFHLSQAGTYVWHGRDSQQILEVTVPAGQQRRIDVPTGHYLLSWRDGTNLAEKQVNVQPGILFRMNSDSFALPPTPGAAVANKGSATVGPVDASESEVPSVSLAATTLVSGATPTPVYDSALDVQSGVGTQLVPHASITAGAALTFEHRIAKDIPLVWDISWTAANAQLSTPAVPSNLFSTGAMLGLRAVQAPATWLEISYGLRLGGTILVQHHDQASATQLAPSAAAVLRFEIPVSARWFAVTEVQQRVTKLNLGNAESVGDYRMQTLGTVGVGFRF